MASAGGTYLPDLAKCFAGEAVVFSWEDAYRALISKGDITKNQAIQALTKSSNTKVALSSKVPQFQPPSQGSYNQFETQTAAINVSPSTNESYDIEQIKSDSLWLSKEVSLAEEEALRITILEWQRRPAERLRSGYSEAEKASLREALGGNDTSRAQDIEQIFIKRDDLEFEAAVQRQKRILDINFRERVGLLSVSKELQELALLSRSETTEFNDLMDLAQQVDHLRSPDNGISSITDAVDSRMRALDSGKSWKLEVEGLNDLWVASELECIQVLLEILLLRIRASTETTPTEVLLKWLQIMAGCEFFAGLQPNLALTPIQVERLQALASLNTVAMLDPATVLGTLTDPSSSTDPQTYFLLSETASDIHDILFSAAEACLPAAGPPALAWTLILGEIRRAASIAKETRESGTVQRVIDQGVTHDTATGRRTSSGSFQQSVYEDVIDAIMNTSPVSDPVAYMLRCTIEAGHALNMVTLFANLTENCPSLLSTMRLQVLQELITVAVSTVGYTPEILSSQFAILFSSDAHSNSDLPDARETFIKNDFLMDNMFAVAAARFPYESLPFLRLCKLLSTANIFDERGVQYIAFRLRSLENYTQLAAGPFSLYHTIREDENLNLVALDHHASIFNGSQSRLLTNTQNQRPMSVMAANTVGEVISESIPPVIRWQHSYSGLALIGIWLELYYLGQLQSTLSSYESADDVVTECIGVLTRLLRNGPKSDDKVRKQIQIEILDDVSSNLQTDSTVVDYVFEILEQELQAYRRRPSNMFNTSVLIACVDFVSILSEAQPDQFWLLFSKSSLLDSYGADSFLMSIVNGVEVPSQIFPFLQACSRLYESTTSAALRQTQVTNPGLRIPSVRKLQPQALRLQSNILSSMTQSLYGVFEAIPGWDFSSRKQRCHIVKVLSMSFERVLLNAYSIGKPTSGLAPSFVPAADFLLQQIRIKADEVSSATSVLRHVFNAEEGRSFAQLSTSIEPHTDALHSLLSLSRTLVRLGQLLLQPTSALERQLFSAIPLFCRNLSRSMESSWLLLLQDLLDSFKDGEPLSLLGHLGSVSSVDFLEILKFNLQSSNDESLINAIWDLLARLVGRNQQWLALVILTGSPPSRSKKGNEDKADSVLLTGKTFLEVALSRLTRIAESDSNTIIPMLTFVIHAQQNWSWASHAVQTNKEFFPTILSFVCNTYVDASDELRTCHRNKVASLVTDLSTIRLHFAKATRDTTTLKAVAPLLRWLGDYAVTVASYNQSLQQNLRRNFGSRFSGLDLSDFKRTGLATGCYGENYYYDVDFAEEVLSHDQSWNGKSSTRGQSFAAEFRRANLNLSVVDSEISLLHSFLGLSIEHSGYFAQDHDVQKSMIDIIHRCLDANMQAYPPEKIFESIFQTRADLSLALLQRLVEVKVKGADVRSLLRAAWECARARNGSFDQAIVNDDLSYWRSMLTIILMTLKFHTDRRYMPPAADSSPASLLSYSEQSNSTILEIITVVVGQGFKSVATAIQDQKQVGHIATASTGLSVTHRDMVLILTIFETILRMVRLPEFVSEASERLIAESAVQSGLVLYSWSHLLTEPDLENQPIYANSSLRFLALLSSMPPVSEELAVEGVLSRLLSSRMTQRLQAVPDGAGHVDKRPHVQALYTMWATAMLPICLNLLHSVGAPVAAEVSLFLNQFPNQLSRASIAFIPPSQTKNGSSDAITLAVANEATTLALISFVLDSFRYAGASAAIDPSQIQSLSGYDEEKKALIDDISDLITATAASLKNRVIATNEKELLVAQENDGEGLVRKVVAELQNASICLKGTQVEEDEK